MRGVFLLFALFATPLILLNFLGGIVGFAWLAVLGEWTEIFHGFLYLFVGAILISFLLVPGFLLALPAVTLAERHPSVAAILLIPNLVWTYAVITFTCVSVFTYLVRNFEGSPIPYLLWAYSVVTGPWSYMASKEDRDNYAGMALFFAQLGTAAMMLAVLIDPYDTGFLRLVWWFAPFVVAGFSLQLVMGVLLVIEERRTRI